MKTWVVYTLIGVAAGLSGVLQACHEDVSLFETGTPQPLDVHTRAATGDAVEALLIFWKDGEYHDKWMDASPQAEPYYEIPLPGNINRYNQENGIPFVTDKEYPIDNSYLHVTGYAPYSALSPVSGQGYVRLEVGAAYRDGHTDFLSCDGDDAHKGSAQDLFIQPKHELKFRHLTARVRVAGVRAMDLYGQIMVNNVTVTLHDTNGLYVPEVFEVKTYNPEPDNKERHRSTYVATGLQPLSKVMLKSGTADFLPAGGREEAVDIASCYVLHDKLPEDYDPFTWKDDSDEHNPDVTRHPITLVMDIEADFYLYRQGDSPLPLGRQEWRDQCVTISSTLGPVFYPGYEYVVYVTFNRNNVYLQGVQKGWDDGGIHYVPIPPQEKEN